MRTLSFIFISSLFFIGCANTAVVPGKTTSVKIRYSAYLGKNMPLFILDNGTPYSKKILPNGNKLYAWNSGKHKIYHYGTIGRVLIEDDFMESECEIRLLANSQGRITEITALNNRKNDWNADSCRDYLK